MLPIKMPIEVEAIVEPAPAAVEEPEAPASVAVEDTGPPVPEPVPTSAADTTAAP